MSKSKKQKCLEMWEWLRDNPEKDKNDYLDYLESKGQGDEWEYCWACKEAELFGHNCCSCPITWPGYSCYGTGPYQNWRHGRTKAKIKAAAVEMIKLIKETWKEGIE